MSRITVSTLFPELNKKDNDNITVKSLFDTKNNRLKNEINFSVNSLLAPKIEKRKQIKMEYKLEYKTCLSQIELVNKVGQTDFIFEVPKTKFMLPEYNSEDCINYIKDHLYDNCIDSMVLSKTKIFVSWLDLEENRKARGVDSD